MVARPGTNRTGYALAGALSRTGSSVATPSRDVSGSRLLSLPGADARTLDRAKALTGAAGLALLEMAFYCGAVYAQSAAELWRQFGDNGRRAYAMHLVARPLFLRGDRTRAPQ